MEVVAGEVACLVERWQLPRFAVAGDVLGERTALLLVGSSLICSEVRGVRTERAVSVDVEPIGEAMAFDASREPFPLVGELRIGNRSFADHAADVFCRLRNGPLDLVGDVLFAPAFEFSFGRELHDQVVGVMSEPFVGVTSGRAQSLEFQIDPVGV